MKKVVNPVFSYCLKQKKKKFKEFIDLKQIQKRYKQEKELKILTKKTKKEFKVWGRASD